MAETEEAVPDEVAAMFDLSLKKKKKKKTKTEKTEADAPKETAGEGGDAVDSEVAASSTEFELDAPIYTYAQLLNRVVDFVHQNNPELTDKKRFTMKPPQLMRGNILSSKRKNDRTSYRYRQIPNTQPTSINLQEYQ